MTIYHPSLFFKLLLLLQVSALLGLGFVQGNFELHSKAVHEAAVDHHHHGVASMHFEKAHDASKHQDHSHHNLPVWISTNKAVFLSLNADRTYGVTGLSAVKDVLYNGLYRPPRTAS